MMDADDGAARLRPYMQQPDWLPNDEYYDDGYDDASLFDPDPPDQTGDVDASFVRPYQLTGGRTVPVDPTLALEAQVVAELAALAHPGGLRYEHREGVTLAQDPVSLAELGALLHLHLQVVRVLVADLAAAGHLRVLRPTRASATDPAMIERVIRGLSAIL
jgi:hypothetical protein